MIVLTLVIVMLIVAAILWPRRRKYVPQPESKTATKPVTYHVKESVLQRNLRREFPQTRE